MGEPIPVLLNPKSGSAKGIIELVRRREGEGLCRLHACESRRSTVGLLRACAEGGAARVVIAGGDGTVRLAVNALREHLDAVEIGIVPSGTGNDFARSLGLAIDDPAAALEHALGAPPLPVDIMEVGQGRRSSIVINALTAGAGVDFEQSASGKHMLGALAYWSAAVGALAALPEHDVRVRVDERELSMRVHALAIANGASVGGGFELASDIALDDGLCDVFLLPVQPLASTIMAAMETVFRTEGAAGSVLRVRASSIELRALEPLAMSLDGDRVVRRVIALRVLPGALRVAAGAGPHIDSAQATI